jgi:hypothetical protein
MGEKKATGQPVNWHQEVYQSQVLKVYQEGISAHFCDYALFKRHRYPFHVGDAPSFSLSAMRYEHPREL